MRTDLSFPIKIVQEVHPALAQPQAQTAFEVRAHEVVGELDTSLPQGDFVLLASRVLQALPEPNAHTAMGYPSDKLIQPARFRWVSGGLVVAQMEPAGPTPTRRRSYPRSLCGGCGSTGASNPSTSWTSSG